MAKKKLLGYIISLGGIAMIAFSIFFNPNSQAGDSTPIRPQEILDQSKKDHESDYSSSLDILFSLGGILFLLVGSTIVWKNHKKKKKTD